MPFFTLVISCILAGNKKRHRKVSKAIHKPTVAELFMRCRFYTATTKQKVCDQFVDSFRQGLLYHFLRTCRISTQKSAKVAKATATRPEHPLPFSNKITAGKLQKICKGFSGRSAARLAVLGGVAKLFGFLSQSWFGLGRKIAPQRNYQNIGSFSCLYFRGILLVVGLQLK